MDKLYKKGKQQGVPAKVCKQENISHDAKLASASVHDTKYSLDGSEAKTADEPLSAGEQLSGPLSKETISSILEIEIPDRYFTKEIPRSASFQIQENDMKALLLNRNERSFKRDSWQSLFFQGVKESNPYCSFQVLSSRLSNATKRKRKAGSPLFRVHAKCTFVDCTIKLKLEMQDTSIVNVVYTGDLKHDIQEIRQRPIKGKDREKLKQEFKGGIKPLALYLQQFQQLPAEYLVSGNRDGLGKNSRVFAQIAAESRQGGRMDDSVFNSLQELKEEMNKKVEGGFIQKICASPSYILYWSKYGLDLYNERAKLDALYWDATGSVVRRQEDGKQFLYYELAIRNPVKGKMGIPLTAMLTTDQTLATILDWIRCFRQAEKQKFGHNNIKIVNFPKLIISDQAMVFILAALKEFNGETLDNFLCRAWSIILGKADSAECSKTLVHLCASHFMHSAKLHLKKKDIGGHKLKMFLYIIGLLMNCTNIQDAQELLYDTYVTLGSDNINDKNQKFYDRLVRKINEFNSLADSEINDVFEETSENPVDLNPGRFTEEEFQVLGSASPFKDWNNEIISKAQKLIDEMSVENKTDLFVNPLCSATFRDYLKKKLMPLYPLWGSVLLGDLSRYNENYHESVRSENETLFNSINNIGKTNSTIENRFRILKDICLGGRTQHRLDEFSERLKTSTIGIQKLVALDCLKYPSFIKNPSKRQPRLYKKKPTGHTNKKSPKKHILVHEQWNKPRPQPENLKTKHGKYQQAPQEEIKLKQTPISKKKDADLPVTDSVPPVKPNKFVKKSTNPETTDNLSCKEFCRLSNFGNSCWLNSVLQALAHSQMSTNVLDSKDLCIDLTGTEPSDSEIAVHDIIQVWKYMKDSVNFGTQVPDKILKSAFRSVVAAVPGFSLKHQQDAHEFNSHIIADMANNLIENTLEYHLTEECNECKKTKIRETNVGQSIVLDIENVDSVSLQTLINNFFTSETYTRTCNLCKKDTEHTMKGKTITKFPRTLIILIRRYQVHHIGTRNVVSKKLHNNIHVSPELTLSNQNNFEVNYQFKSAVCHHGDSTSAGHYNSVVRHNSEYICCDDKNISVVDSDYTISTAYLVIYDRVKPGLPLYVEPFLTCWTETEGLRKILKVMSLNPLCKDKKSLLEDLSSKGLTQPVADKIRQNMALDLVVNNVSVADFYKKFIKFLIQSDDFSETLFGDHFQVNTKHIRLCKKCGLVDIQTQTFLTVSVKEFSVGTLCESLSVLQGERVLRMCRCSSKPDVFLMSLPSTLVIHTEESRNLQFENIITLHIPDELKEAYPIGTRKYYLKAVFGLKDNQFFSYLKTDSGFQQIHTGKEITDLTGFQKVFLFYNRNIIIIDHEKEVKCMLHKPDVCVLPYIKAPKETKTDIRNQKESLIFGVRLNREFFSSLIDPLAWLSSDHINVYLSLLARDSSSKVHAINSVWYSQKLVKDSDPQRLQWVFHNTESKVKWFDFDFVLIPINENGSHWTIVVVQIKQKKIIYCNSLSIGRSASYTCHQIWRYLCYEALIHSGFLLEREEWSILYYNDMPGFPKQTDGSSCGVYVCAIAKAIVCNQRLPEEPNLLSLRNWIAWEILKSSKSN